MCKGIRRYLLCLSGMYMFVCVDEKKAFIATYPAFSQRFICWLVLVLKMRHVSSKGNEFVELCLKVWNRVECFFRGTTLCVRVWERVGEVKVLQENG